MGCKGFLGLFLFVIFMEFLTMISSSQAYRFNVGGKDGWVFNPSENFSRWAERNRFQVNDTLCKHFNSYLFSFYFSLYVQIEGT